MKKLEVFAMLFAAFVLGLVCSVSYSPAQDKQEPQEVGSFAWARQVYQPDKEHWPELVEYTYAGQQKFLVFVGKENIFVMEAK
jgi:hypothetical protein